MDISVTYIEERFHHFNELCFDGKLTLPPVRLSSSRRALGQVRFMRRRCPDGRMEFCHFDFAISGLLAQNMCEHEVEDTILHEMIHYHILSNQLQDTSAHGVLFRKEMERINNVYHRHITISHHAGEEESRNGVVSDNRLNVVAVLRLHDDCWGMMVVARTRVRQLWNQLERIPEVKQVLWFLSDNPYFNRFPRRSTLKYHPMKASDLIDKLSGAHLLVRNGNDILVNGCDIKSFIE